MKKFRFGLAAAIPVLLIVLLVLSRQESRGQGNQPMRIMCLGASITQGSGVNGGYRLPLEKMFEGAGIPVQFVGRADSNSNGMTSPQHEGYPGFRIDQVQNGENNNPGPIAESVRTLKPDVILLLLGTNDVRQNRALNEAPQRMDNLIGILQEAAPNVRIFVSSLPPLLYYDDGLRRYNAGVAEVVSRRAAAGQKVSFVDNYAVLNAATDISADRTHPNAAGYLKIARNWFNALAPNAPQVAFTVSKEGAAQATGQACSGYQITMKQAATVTDLGIYGAGGPLPDARAVGIYDSEGHLLTKVEIAPSDAPSGLFIYKKLETPLNLEAGKSYIFVSNNVGLPILRGSDAIVDPLHFDNPRFYYDHNSAKNVPAGNGTALTFPGTNVSDTGVAVGFFGVNFRLAP